MAKHPDEISLELKEKRMKKENDNTQCMFTQVNDINHYMQEIGDRLDQLPSSSDIFIWNKKLGDTREILDENFNRCNAMLNQIQDLITQVYHFLLLINEYEQKKWWKFWK